MKSIEPLEQIYTSDGRKGNIWKFLLKDGFFCVEIDSDQVNTVSSLFIGQNISSTGIYRDLSGRNRCVVFHNRKNNLKNKINMLKSEFPSCENSY